MSSKCLEKRKPEITAILMEYGVPLVDGGGTRDDNHERHWV